MFSSPSDTGSDPGFPTTDGPVVSGTGPEPGLDGMSYYPWAVPAEVGQWQILVDNQTDADADYVIEDETTGETIGSGTNPAGASAAFTIPDGRLGDRISLVHDESSGSGLLSCHVLADDAEVGSAASTGALTCSYDPDSLHR